MAKLLFSLRGVPDDEAEDVRDLLTSNDIDYYETPAGKWGISAPAFWMKNPDQLEQARALIDDYQQQRFVSEREKYEQSRREGRHRTFVDIIREDPLKVLVYLAIVAGIIYFSIKPFLLLVD
jgi:hypothetical protein